MTNCGSRVHALLVLAIIAGSPDCSANAFVNISCSCAGPRSCASARSAVALSPDSRAAVSLSISAAVCAAILAACSWGDGAAKATALPRESRVWRGVSKEYYST